MNISKSNDFVQEQYQKVQKQFTLCLASEENQRSLPPTFNSANYSKQALCYIRNKEYFTRCTADSIARCLLEAATYDLDITFRDEAYIVPFENKKNGKTEASLLISYKGMLTLAYRSKKFKQIYAAPVYEGDYFTYELGFEPKLIHRPVIEDYGKRIGVYAIAKMVDGDPFFVVLKEKEIQEIKNKSRNSTAWRDFPDEMAKKSAIKRLLKTLPFRGDWEETIAESDSKEEQGDFIDVEAHTPPKPKSLDEALNVQEQNAKPQTQEQPQAQAATEEAPAKETKAKPKSKAKAKKQEPATPATPEAIEPIEEQPPTDVPAKVEAQANHTTQVNEAVNAANPSYNIHDKYDDLIDALGANEYSGYIVSNYAKEHQTTIDLSKAYFCEHRRELAMIVENLRQSHPQPQ